MFLPLKHRDNLICGDENMFGDFNGWLLAVILIALVWIYLLIRKGPVAALGAAMVLSFAFPVWIKVNPFGIPITVQTTTACLVMLGYVCHRDGRIRLPLTLLDFSIAMMWICHVTSDSFMTGFTPVLPARAYGEWALPYIAGRYAIRGRNDLNRIAPWVVGVIVFLGLMSCFESLTQVNPFEFVFGDRPTELSRRNTARLGLKRAFGPTTHAIFFGMMIGVLMPWLVCLWQSFGSRKIRGLTAFAGLVAFAGAVFTVSRTPVISILMAAALTLALGFKVLRWPLGLSMAIAIGVFVAFPNEVTDTISRWTGGGDKPNLVEIDGEAVVTSSSRTRLHVFGIYKDALIKAGPFGYGSEATSGFPLEIPGMEGTFKSANLFVTVDNAYVLLTLRFGWIGGACLVILFLTAIATGFSLYFDRPDQLFPGAMACLLVVVAGFSLLLVFMSYDFGFPLLWTIGILSGLASARHCQCC